MSNLSLANDSLDTSDDIRCEPTDAFACEEVTMATLNAIWNILFGIILVVAIGGNVIVLWAVLGEYRYDISTHVLSTVVYEWALNNLLILYYNVYMFAVIVISYTNH